jgi:hypothetical protein
MHMHELAWELESWRNQNSWSPAVNRPVELFGRTEAEKGEEGE